MTARTAVRRTLERLLRATSRRLGFTLVPRHFYSPIPDLAELPESAWAQPRPLGGLELDLEAQVRFLEDELAPYVAEFRPPTEDRGRHGEFFLDNGAYERVDAEVLYAMVRHFKPRRVLELGSGFSTLVTAQAAAANERDGHPLAVTSVDPFPSVAPGQRIRLRRQRAQDVPLPEFEALESGDILFVDTTHTVKVGGDVNFLVLEVLPVLRPGVVVHFHDIFLPWDYPREWIARGMYWAEQYLLQAFLAFNPAFETLFAAHYVSRQVPDRLRAVVPSFRSRTAPGAFWIRRRSQPSRGG